MHWTKGRNFVRNTPPAVGGAVGVGWWGRGQVVQKMNTVSFYRAELLELVVPIQSFAEVGHLAADKQVVLIQNFRFGQAAVLVRDRTDIVNRVTVFVIAENSWSSEVRVQSVNRKAAKRRF